MKKLEYPILLLIGLIAFGSIFYAWSLKAKAQSARPMVSANRTIWAGELAVVAPQTPLPGFNNLKTLKSPLPAAPEVAPTPALDNAADPLPTPMTAELTLIAPTPVPDIGLPPVAPTPRE